MAHHDIITCGEKLKGKDPDEIWKSTVKESYEKKTHISVYMKIFLYTIFALSGFFVGFTLFTGLNLFTQSL